MQAVPAGTYVYGDFCTGEIFGWDGSSQTVLLGAGVNISSFGEDEAGELYVVGLGGSVSRIAAVATSCTYAASPSRATFTAQGGTGTVNVTTGAGCGWSATSGESWIAITSGATGSGSGTVTYSVAPYSGRQGSRNGKLTIANQTTNIRQSR